MAASAGGRARPATARLQGHAKVSRAGRDAAGQRLTAEQAASALILLHDTAFGGQPAGRRLRMSSNSLRDLTARRLLTATFVDEVALRLAEADFDLIRMEDYVVVQRARLHEGLRRVPAKLRQAAREAALAGADRITLRPKDASGDDDDEDP